jgi:magnesium-transporting ATPase (P-type)
MTLVRLVAFVGPPKESAAPALLALAGHGVRVKVLSGDNASVARHVCAQVGSTLPEIRPLSSCSKRGCWLDDSVMEGRTTFCKMHKYIRMTASPNFGNVLPVLVASAALAWHPHAIRRFMLCFGPVSSVFDLAAFAVMWYVFGAQTVAQQWLFQSGWFVVGLLTQTLVVHFIRTP